MKRPKLATAPKRLIFFATEQNVGKESPLWPQITTFQRQGFVRLRWDESSAYCHVKLTPAGEVEAKRRQDTGSME
jgi:hypothetical protein